MTGLDQLSIYDEFAALEAALAAALEEVDAEPEAPLDGQLALLEFPKPAYRRPTMLEIRTRPKNGLTMVSTFSGCGGSCLGFKRAGFDVRFASEFVPAAAETYATNFPETTLDRRDVRELKAGAILDAIGLSVGELDVFEGSPPCSSFSTAGKGEEGWGEVKSYSGGIKQRTDDLFDEWARLLVALQPRVAVAENVPGLSHGNAAYYLRGVLRKIAEAGYGVDFRVLDAAWFGAATRRRRLFIIAVRGRRGSLALDWPTPFPYRYSLRDALEEAGPQTPEDLAAVSIEKYAINESWTQTKIGAPKGEIYFSLLRPPLDSPCPTLTATMGSIGAASVCHPHERRKFTPEEAKAISGIPRDFVLTGSVSEQLERVGRAVPPPLSYALATWIAEEVVPLAV